MKLSDLPSVDEAMALSVQAAARLVARRPLAAERVALEDALGRILASEVLSDHDQPPFDRSAMDGYALRSADVPGEEGRLEVVGEVAAGDVFEGEVGPGEAVAIMTGAPLPAGADCVQMVEKTRREAARVVIGDGPMFPGRNVAPQGEDVRVGDVVVEAGTHVRGLVYGVLASVGATEVSVLRRPTVAILSTGDELVEVDQPLAPGQIRDSNRHTLFALAQAAGAEVTLARNVADDPEVLRAAVREGLERDVLLLSGGVSAGVYDLVAAALADEGVEILLHKARLKPGKPVLIGQHAQRGGGLVFGLPGNPVSSFVTAHLFALPAIRTLLGQTPGPWAVDAILEGTIPRTKGRTTFEPGRVEPGEGGALRVTRVGWNGSGDQAGFSRCNCMIRREIGQPAGEPGERVRVVLLQPPAL